MKRDIKREYSNGELTIVWEPAKCIHSTICIQMLPEVYDPMARPWVTPENATTEELKEQIDQCPTGALSYYMNSDKKSAQEEAEAKAEHVTAINVAKNGPLLVAGDLKVTLPSGEVKECSGNTAFCRCGASHNKPFCDGTHKSIGFVG